jgi:O-antigen/teichoic acid export membrane protein
MGLLALAEASRSLSITAALIVLAATGAGVQSSPYAFLAAECVVLLILGAACIRAQPPARPCRACVRPLLGFGAKTALADAAGDLNTRLDVLIIGLFHDASAVGIYTLASAGAKALWLLPAGLQRVTHPLFVQLHNAGRWPQFHRTLDVVLRCGLVVFSVAGLAGAVLAGPIIMLLYPHRAEMLAAVLPLYYLLPGAVVHAVVSGVGTAATSGIGRPGSAVRITVLMLVVNLLLNLALVPRLGGVGAALATTVCLLAGFCYNARLLRVHVDYRLPWIQFAGVLFVFGSTLGATYWWRQTIPYAFLLLGGLIILLAALFSLRLVNLLGVRDLLALFKRPSS